MNDDKLNFQCLMLHILNMKKEDQKILSYLIEREEDLYFIENEDEDFPEKLFTLAEVKRSNLNIEDYTLCEFANEHWLDYAIIWVNQKV